MVQADVPLFHLGDPTYLPPPVAGSRPDFPAPARTGCVPFHFSARPDFGFTNPDKVLYAVVDAARDYEFAYLAKQSGFCLVSLFVGAMAPATSEAAPYFFQVPHGAPFLAQW